MKRILMLVVSSLFLAMPVSGQSLYSFTTSSAGGYLGVTIREVESDDLIQLRLEKESGVVIESVLPGTPAEDADLQPDDVLLVFDGETVRSVRQFQRLVADTPPGRGVTVTIWRKGTTLQRNLVLSKREPSQAVWNSLPGMELSPLELPEVRVETPKGSKNFFFVARRPLLGIRGQALTEQLAETLGVSQKAGVLVMEVMEDTPAEQAGVKAGDVIVACDGTGIEEISDLSSHMKSGQHQLELIRDKKSLVLPVTIEEKKGKSIPVKGDAVKL